MFDFIKNLFKQDEKISDKEKFSLENTLKFVEDNIDYMTRSSVDDITMSAEEIENARERKRIFNKELKSCGLGDLSAKIFIKKWMLDLLTLNYGVNEQNINYIINFDFPTTYDKFCIIFQEYFKQYKYDALGEILKHYNLDKPREVYGEKSFIVTKNDIDKIYMDMLSQGYITTYEEKLEIVVQRIYENSHGLSVIDDIRDQNIEGLSLGVSGVPNDFKVKISDMKLKGDTREFPLGYNSVWIYFEGKEINFEFISFENERNFERVCKRVFRFNNQSQFAREDGFIFNNMADLSRVAVFRPPFAESWAVFIRKFGFTSVATVKDMVQGDNDEIVQKLLYYLIRGKENVCYTGQQGAGKTTLLIAGLKELYPNLTIRVWESFFESFLRLKMPYRNILTLREIDGLDGEKALDSLKKSNGQVTVIAEAATDQVISYIIKTAMTASECVHWTHHANTADDLVKAHRNACINAGVLKNEMIAEDQVLSVLNINIHRRLITLADGSKKRIIERITHFERLDQEPFSRENSESDYYKNSRMYYEKQTNAKKYETVNLVEYDFENGGFIIKNKISNEYRDKLYNKLEIEDRENFLQFVDEFNALADKDEK